MRIMMPFLAIVLVASCGADTSGPIDLDLLEDPEAVILEVRHEGGFAPVEWLIGQPPQYAVTAGGTLYLNGPQIEIFPQPLLPNLQRMQLDEERMDTLLRYVSDIGLAEIVEEANTEATDRIADAPDTIVTFWDRSGSHRFRVYALGFGETFSDARVNLLAQLVGELDEAAFGGGPAEQYTSDRVEVHVGQGGLDPDPQFVNTRVWPAGLDPQMLGPGSLGWRCGVFEGATGEALLAEFAQANRVTTWELQGEEYGLVARPLFPYEAGCGN